MKKKLLTFALLLFLTVPAFSSTFDMCFTFGQQSMFTNLNGQEMYLGTNIGITKKIEASLWCESSITPDFFADNTFGVGMCYAFLGNRNTGTAVAGPGINMLINAGLLINDRTDEDYWSVTGAYVSLTPLTIGSPSLSHRERCFEIGCVYNWYKNEFRVIFSLFKLDWYFAGTYRDYDYRKM